MPSDLAPTSTTTWVAVSFTTRPLMTWSSPTDLGLELRLALVIENFRDRNHAFGLGSDIDDHVGRGQLHDAPFDDVVLPHRFLGFGLEALQGGGEVIAGSRRGFDDRSRGSLALGSLDLRSVFLSSGNYGSIILMSVRGG